MEKGDIVYVIKWKYIEGNCTYYAKPMIYSTTRGRYIYCRSLCYKDKQFSCDTIYASIYGKESNRVFRTLEEAEKNVKVKQKEHDIFKKYEELAKRELEEL